ncbi:MAG: aromatic amino acid hydroxylase [Lentimicrobium sp.]|jgi:phenylalanine-4-hydroxylase|nr:aromatic amino acid hydroxylase [Lentimicrobium sp.]MDD2526787.1 aromatic amino acid hydroxylase [Lentimicrobiaceae bacterium]MDD4596511.1 aromatic amino acid hydroxylase [Lentimicrobiaceae bacterium]MDY0024753.1 aromatic amino acid hydroxylase [Lentimicrobium sp.]HAH58788.1 aromatic amino acid hydroxylase [Bacteroidales bacterium]
MELNEVLKKLPAHLMDLVIDQPYNEYTAQDHAVWRYVMRQNVRILSKLAHGSYLEGLKKTGISINAIPHMYGMNRILKEIGWAAVAVDGFIPPQAFMEFQAYNVLVIAADIRPIDQIAYTPAPDIIHEAAGHAPIIADPDYANYLRHFGETGAKAFSSKRDYEQYEAIRHLSILKADPYTPKDEIEAAMQHLSQLEASMGKASEMSLIRNLHWWTVEYGLIGTITDFKIYGAGLLSSIGESINCLKPTVKKLPYTLEAVHYNFDITTQQPQLFVTPDFNHLNEVLNDFAESMAFKRGGMMALEMAKDSGNTATIELSSGIQISGTFEQGIIQGDEMVYLQTSGPTMLSFGNKMLQGHEKENYPDGFGSPLGLLQHGQTLENMGKNELAEIGIIEGSNAELAFRSGIRVSGTVEYMVYRNDKVLLIGWRNASVKFHETTLFKPEDGAYVVAAGNTITSAYPGPADAAAFNHSYKPPAERTHKIQHTDKSRKLHALYQEMREVRDQLKTDFSAEKMLDEIERDFPGEWLLYLELLEWLEENKGTEDIKSRINQWLSTLKISIPELSTLIDDGLTLIYNKQPIAS